MAISEGQDQAATIGKLHPKLRMLANGSTEVNALRAEHAAAVKVSDAVAEQFPVLRAQSDVPATAGPLTEPVTTETLEGRAGRRGQRLPRAHRRRGGPRSP